MSRDIKKYMYLRRCKCKITILWCPKIQIFYIFCENHDTMMPKNIKLHVLKTPPRQTHTTMMPKNAQNFWFFVKITLWCPTILKKKHVFKMSLSKITLLWYPKNTDNLYFFVKITILWCRKILKKTCTLGVRKENHTTMMPKEYR